MYGHDRPNEMSSPFVKREYVKFIKSTTVMKAVEAKHKMLKAKKQKIEREIQACEKKVLFIKSNFLPKIVDKKQEAITAVDSIIRSQRHVAAASQPSEGGTYAHLTTKSINDVCLALKEKANFDRSSVLLDVGAGLNIPALYAATNYCAKAVGVEIDSSRAKCAADLILEHFLKQGHDGVRNHRVALINADIVALRPVAYASHVFMFDLAFTPELYLQIIDWLQHSKCEYIVTFKPIREPIYMKLLTEKLNAIEIDRIKGLCMAGSHSKCTAIIYKRDVVVVNEVFPELIDSFPLARPFLTDSMQRTIHCYERLKNDLERKIEESHTRRSTRNNPHGPVCRATDGFECDRDCSRCRTLLRPIQSTLLSIRASAIHGRGLCTQIGLESHQVVAIYPESTVDESGHCDEAGRTNEAALNICSWVNHSCRPNARLAKIVYSDGNKVTAVVTSVSVQAGDEISLDYSDDKLSKFKCRCLSPFCRQKPKVLLLGMVQYNKMVLREIVTQSENQDMLARPIDVELLQSAINCGKISVQHARDMYRCIKTADACHVGVFTMDSNDKSADRFDKECHMVGAFDSPKAIEHIQALAQPVQFREVVLDYFWCPDAWAKEKWKSYFFHSTLPQLAKQGLLEVGGTIYLPFTPYVLDMATRYEDILKSNYVISAQYTDKLDQVSLWRGTEMCSDIEMLTIFQKDKRQEEKYCVVTSKMLTKEASDRFGNDPNLTKARFLSLQRNK